MQRTPSSPPDIDGYVVDRLIGSAGAVPPHRAKKLGSARGLSASLLNVGALGKPLGRSARYAPSASSVGLGR